MATQFQPVTIPAALLSLERVSKLTIALNVITNVIKFCSRAGGLTSERLLQRWGTDHYHECAKLYLIQSVQQQCFNEVIEFLKDPREKVIPDLVRNYNLFLDKFGTLRSDCRVGKKTFLILKL